MSFKKSSFTLAEILITLVIIGVIIILELIVLEGRQNQYGAPYHNAYNALKKASYNVLADMYCPDDKKPVDQQVCPDGPRDFPQTSEELCKRLIEFINIPQGESNCSAPDINDEQSNIGKETLRFTATNAFRFYISDKKTFDFDELYPTEDQRAELNIPNNSKIDYFIVYVDLNGEKNPNKVRKDENDKLFPDIVPFALTTRGEVIPMGFPIYHNMYLTAKIKYPAVEMDGKIVENRYSASTSFYQAVVGAWGNIAHPDIPFSIPFNNQLSAYAQSWYQGLIPTDAVLKDGEGCTGGNYNCRVIVDSATEKRY